ncbi:MAG: hypothetical protein Q4C16_09430, partial [Eubacteriales bacterium]|nr:hypothetical protein [Eubacteriales bacterium]
MSLTNASQEDFPAEVPAGWSSDRDSHWTAFGQGVSGKLSAAGILRIFSAGSVDKSVCKTVR